MRFTKWDYFAFPILAAILLGAALGALRLVGFFGLGVLGLVIAFITVRIDLEADGEAARTGLRGAASQTERAELEMARRWRRRPLFTAQIVATGFIILGFGLHFLT